jgi:hypothetical protein
MLAGQNIEKKAQEKCLIEPHIFLKDMKVKERDQATKKIFTPLLINDI